MSRHCPGTGRGWVWDTQGTMAPCVNGSWVCQGEDVLCLWGRKIRHTPADTATRPVCGAPSQAAFVSLSSRCRSVSLCWNVTQITERGKFDSVLTKIVISEWKIYRANRNLNPYNSLNTVLSLSGDQIVSKARKSLRMACLSFSLRQGVGLIRTQNKRIC